MDKIKAFLDKYSKEIIVPTAVILSICILVTAALSITNKVTKPTIDKITEQNQEETMKMVLKADDYIEQTAKYQGEEITYHTAKTKGITVGYVFITSENGYGGAVSVMTAVNTHATVMSVAVLDVSNETPGLGQNATKEDFYSKFSGVNEQAVVVKETPQNINEIKALTGATITSKAVTNAVNKARTYAKAVIDNQKGES